MAKTARSKKQPETASASPQSAAATPAPAEPSPEAVARRAYEIFLERGGQTHGNDVDDWLRAELELRAKQK